MVYFNKCNKLREKLFSDIEKNDFIYFIFFRELIDNLSAARQQKINVQHQLLLTEQLVATDNEIKATLKVAEHQAEVEKKVNSIKAEIETQDQHITQMQKHFKEAENILVMKLIFFNFTVCVIHCDC